MHIADSSTFNILVVEDNFEVAENVVFALNCFGLNATHAATGAEALHYLDHHKPDLVLLDLSLAGVSGWQVLDSAKKKYGAYDLPVIVTTGYTDKTNRMIARLQYVRRYLIKPFSTRELYEAVDEVLELYKVGV